MRGLRIGDRVIHKSSKEIGIIKHIDRVAHSREIKSMGIEVEWLGIPKDTGVTTFQYEYMITPYSKNYYKLR